MASTITKTKTIRIANETADYFEGKALNRLVESVHHAIEGGKMSFDGENIKILGQNIPECQDLVEMLELFGVTMDDFIKQADEALAEGEITISDGKLVCTLPDWAEKLSDTCQEMGYDVAKIADSAIKSLKKGAL